MAEKKPTKKTQQITDVEKPGKSAASATSKPVIVTNRPLIKDPMVVKDSQEKTEEQPTLTKKTSTKPKIQPLEPSPEPEEVEDVAPEKKPDETLTQVSESSKSEDKKTKKTVEDSEEAAAKRKAEHDANLQKIADAKTYYLPINAVEKRRTKRFVTLGVLLSILLLLVWIDIALDAELVQIDGINSITSFF